MNRVLVIGPIPEPTTGVSLANKVVVENLEKNSDFKVDYINTSYNKFEESLGSFSFSKALFYLKLNLYSYKVFKSSIIYITPGQTFFGVFKYVIFFIIAKFLKKEIIVHVHGNYLGKEYYKLRGIKKSLFKTILGFTSKGIVLSDSLKDNLRPFISEENIFVLNNFVEDYLLLDETEINNKLSNTKPQIIYLSNLMEEKGIFILLEALKILENEGFNYEARIAGNIDIGNKQKTEQYFNLLKNCKYEGVVSGNKKKELLLWGNTFVLPTYYKMEGQPISILEAMITSNLVLTTNHAGIPDIFQNKVNGYYIDKQNPKNIAELIKTVSTDIKTSTEIRKQNYFFAKNKFTVSNFIFGIIKIIEA